MFQQILGTSLMPWPDDDGGDGHDGDTFIGSYFPKLF